MEAVAGSCLQVQFKQPLTSIRSGSAFANAVKAREDFTVFAAGLVPVQNNTAKKTGNAFFCRDATKICEINESSTTTRTYSKRNAPKEKSQPAMTLDDGLGDLDEDEAAEEYDQECSMAYLDQNATDSLLAPDISAADQRVGDSHDTELRKNILAARKDGCLPLEIKINLLGSTSCYTESELEQMAVDHHLRQKA